MLRRSAAEHVGRRTIGRLLAGMERDGPDGLAALRQARGQALVLRAGKVGEEDSAPRSWEQATNHDWVSFKQVASQLCLGSGMPPQQAPSPTKTATKKKRSRKKKAV